MRRFRVAKRGEGGQALTEFALISLIFFMLVFGMIDIGRAVWHYNALAEATREGTRYAIVHGGDSSDPSGPGSAYYTPPHSDTQVSQVVENHAGSLNTSQLTVETTWIDGTNEKGNRVTVSSQYTYTPIFNMFGILEFSMSSSSTMAIAN